MEAPPAASAPHGSARSNLVAAGAVGLALLGAVLALRTGDEALFVAALVPAAALGLVWLAVDKRDVASAVFGLTAVAALMLPAWIAITFIKTSDAAFLGLGLAAVLLLLAFLALALRRRVRQ